MSDWTCPYCGADNEETEYWEQTPEEDFETMCGRCKRELKVSYHMKPVFSVTTPDELEICREPKQCICYNSFSEFCEYPGDIFLGSWANDPECEEFFSIPGVGHVCPQGYKKVDE